MHGLRGSAAILAAGILAGVAACGSGSAAAFQPDGSLSPAPVQTLLPGQAGQRLGWRVYATKHPAEALTLAQGVAAYRSAYLIAQGFGRLKGRSWSLTPLLLQYAPRVVGLLSLLSLALRVLVLMQCVVRRHLQRAGPTRKGLSPGQRGRQTAKPTTERMLQAFRGVTRSRIQIDGKLHEHLTPLNDVQKRILTLMEVPLEISDGLVT